MAAMRAFEHDQYPWETCLENSFASTLTFEETKREIRLRISRELVLENKRSLGALSTPVKQHSTRKTEVHLGWNRCMSTRI